MKKKRIDEMKMYEKIKKVEELREKFKNDLVGHWSSCQGTFDSIMNEEWIFNADGTGESISRSLSREEKEEFYWRKNGERCIDMMFDEGDWVEVFYDFKLTATEYGYFPTLVELDPDKNPRKGFGIFEVSLSYEGEEN
ncbi:MAG: hypothetical protein N2645_03795 [Clostridia bacterium]|nr:hypothetical protein [Clostridia bacterium]